MFASREFAKTYFAPRYWPRHVLVPFTTFAGRGPGIDGNITPIISDYDSFFLTDGEAEDAYLQFIPAEYLTQDEADTRYLQSIPSEYITQTEADAQGMPTIEAGGTGATSSPVREVNADFTLLAVSSPALFQQTYFNIGTSPVIVGKPAGYLNTLGSTSISSNTSAIFIKRAGVAQFIRWS